MARTTYSFIIIYLTNLVSVSNRYGHVPVQTNLQDEFKVNDEAIGSIMAIFYIPFVITAIIYGYLGDRYNRKLILVLTTTVQSIGVAGCGFSGNMMTFYAAKILIGVTQSACITLAPTVISDMYHGVDRTKMLGVFATSVAIGSGVGMMGMGALSKIYGRQNSFLVFAGLTLSMAILYLMFVPDYERGGNEKETLKSNENPDSSKKNSIIDDCICLCKNATYMAAIFAFAATSSVCETTIVWYQELIRRLLILQPRQEINPCKQDYSTDVDKYCLDSDFPNATDSSTSIYSNINCNRCESKQISDIFGIILLTCGLVGTMSGIVLVQILIKKSSNAGPKVASAGQITTSVLMLILIFYLKDLSTMLIWISTAIILIFATSCFGIIQDVIARVIVPERRGLAVSLQNLVGRAIGSSFPPILAGKMSDYYLQTSISNIENAKAENIDVLYQDFRFESLKSAFYIVPAYAILSGLVWMISARKFKNNELK